MTDPAVKRAEHLFRLQALRTASAESCARPRAFLTAGPSEEIAWDPATTRAAIVTSGKVCPGVNTIIRELFNCLTYVYGVPSGNIFGVRNGFCGFREPLVPLTSEIISKVGEAGAPLRVGCAPVLSAPPLAVAPSQIHKHGGSILGMTRGGFDLEATLSAVREHKLGMVFIVGGIDAHQSAVQLQRGAAAARIKASRGGAQLCGSSSTGTLSKRL